MSTCCTALCIYLKIHTTASKNSKFKTLQQVNQFPKKKKTWCGKSIAIKNGRKKLTAATCLAIVATQEIMMLVPTTLSFNLSSTHFCTCWLGHFQRGLNCRPSSQQTVLQPLSSSGKVSQTRPWLDSVLNARSSKRGDKSLSWISSSKPVSNMCLAVSFLCSYLGARSLNYWRVKVCRMCSGLLAEMNSPVPDLSTSASAIISSSWRLW